MEDAGTVAIGKEWDDAALVDAERAVVRRREILLAVLACALLILVGVGSVYFFDLLDQRDATIRALDTRITNLETANGALSKEVSVLTTERTDLLATRETLTRERDGLISERAGLIAERSKMVEEINLLSATRDQVAADRDQLNTRLNDLDRQLVDLGGKLDASQADASAAHLDVARQTDRAKAAETQVQQYSAIVKLDNDLNTQIGVFLGWFSQLDDAYVNGDAAGFATALGNCQTSAARLDSLRRQRSQLVSQSGT
jgi:chromosome segregation ATPase